MFCITKHGQRIEGSSCSTREEAERRVANLMEGMCEVEGTYAVDEECDLSATLSDYLEN